MNIKTYIICAAALSGCGGSPSPADAVQACGAQILPRVLACIPPDYRGVDASQLTPCLRGAAGLLVELQQCQREEPAAFADYLDHRVGHAARVLVESLTDGTQ